MRILIAGLQHETNTFAPTKATYESFMRGEGYPAMARGAAVMALRDVNIPIGGFIRTMEAGHDLVPVIWAGASPSAHVTRDAYERIVGEVTAAAKDGGFDAIYLDLHGAMVTEHHDDGEGELLSRLRKLVGGKTPIVASLDLHANVTAEMLDAADGLVAYRTYPHVDMAATGKAAADLLCKIIAARAQDLRLHCVYRRLPFLIAINGMCTLLEPARGAYRAVEAVEAGDILSVSFAPGFPASDFPECGPVVWGYGLDAPVITAAIEKLARDFTAAEAAWDVSFLSADAAVKEAIRLSHIAARPIVIADTQDNPGAGGDSDTMGVLRALIENKAEGAAIGLIYDAMAASAAHQAGKGATVKLALGGRSGTPGDSPLDGDFEVEHLSDGNLVFDGPMMNGMKVALGPVASLRTGGIRIAVSSTKCQMLDRNLFRVAGIEPESMKILVNKSSVHFRADFAPIAAGIIIAKAPGPMAADPADLPWTRLAPGIRIRPGGAAFNG